jgi:L-alanine-DL-glutamate epimerase-like enolase superfamily enzyme
MGKPTDIRPVGAQLYFLPVHTRMPLKFGPETVTYVTCARACVTVRDAAGRTAQGWGETPLSVTWVWPSTLSYEDRHEAMKRFCEMLTTAWAQWDRCGHPMEVGQDFIDEVLPGLLDDLNRDRAEPMPWLGALVCCSVFDQALHDAYGQLHGVDV